MDVRQAPADAFGTKQQHYAEPPPHKRPHAHLGDKLHASAIALKKAAGNAKMAYDAGMQIYGIGKAVAPLIAPLLV